MRFCGYNKTTLLDFPGHVAATLFAGGCNMRCPFCHNGDLVLHAGELEAIPEEEILAFLKKRQGILEGVCITGGEPTLYEDLEAFIRKVRALGYLVKLDTNGSNPALLKHLIEEGLLDYVAMDIKSSKQHYPAACGNSQIPMAKIEESVEILKQSSICYEFRTTVVKGIHKKEDFVEIGKWLVGARAYFLQSYKESDCVIQKGFDAFSKKELEEFARDLRKEGVEAQLRGVE